MPKVSVIIPFFDRVDWLMEAVESVLKQTYNDYEIIVVNDGSRETIDCFLAKYGNHVIYKYKENGGAASARNLGIEIASGDYIAFLDSDDIWEDNKLEVQVSYMEEYGAIWSYCSYVTFGKGKTKKYRASEYDEPCFQREFYPHIGTPTVMISNRYLKNHLDCRFHPKLRYGQDAYLWLMMISENPILAIPDVLVKVRMRGENASRSARKQLIARSNLWRLRKEKPDRLIKAFHISKLFVFSSEVCCIENDIVSKVSQKIRSPIIIELVSKCLFVFPWSLYKLDRILDKMRSN